MNIFPVSLLVEEKQGQPRENRPVRIGIPLPRQSLKDEQQLCLLNEQQQPIPFQIKITSRWADNSIRWLLIDFQANIAANQAIEYSLQLSQQKPVSNEIKGIQYEDHGNTLNVDTGDVSFILDKQQFNPFVSVKKHNTTAIIESSQLQLEDEHGELLNAVIEHIEYDPKKSFVGNVSFSGQFKHAEKPSSLRFEAQLTFYANSSLCELDFTLHNPQACQHSGGFWDLGDIGSQYFKSLILNIDVKNNTKSRYKNADNSDWNTLDNQPHRLYQNSSGGKHWDHRLHIDKDEKSTVSFKGYQLHQASTCIQSGDRISPILSIEHEQQNMHVYMHHFWQNFPKAISFEPNALGLEIFPKSNNALYELQGGEKKTHKVSFNFSPNETHLQQSIKPLKVSLKRQHYAQADILLNLPSDYQHNAFIDILNQGVNGENNFFVKRENADEYGWRNFGELWADHETLEHNNDSNLVSHYNNQYDPILGFIKQYLLSSDEKWLTLAKDLVEHVCDIDIYHTNLDRPEYNQGLFWHTDHYLDGSLCTHRTFSKKHMLIDHVEQSGGGPGSEHCYTAGLMYYYFLTGSEAAKQAELKVARWSQYPNEGSHTVIERLFEFLKKDVKKIKRLVAGEYVFKYSFPLNRGTGNYINSVLDLYLTCNETEHLSKAADIIKNTLGPFDDIEQRHLITDIEGNWHYTVLLQSVSRFLSVKESESDFDSDYHYAYLAFNHYAQWLFQNEKPYLENREKLVYPNDTWVAQDLRKASILYSYEKYCDPTIQNSVRERRLFFIHYVEQTIQKSAIYSTRILALLMQSYSPTLSANSSPKTVDLSKQITQQTLPAGHSKLALTTLFTGFISDVFKRLYKINISNEIRWLKNRLR